MMKVKKNNSNLMPKFTLEKFLFDIPIYTKIQIDESNLPDFRSLFYYNIADVEGYNPYTKMSTTYSMYSPLDKSFEKKGGIQSVAIQCKRYGDILTYYCFWDAESNILMKVGQYPSVADIHIGQIKQYDKLLPKEKLKEFTRAIGLAANGVGIGSFVYLRRIFEYLINETYNNEVDFQKTRMDEKINLLKDYLPPFLVQHKTMYSILSLGVHELDEDTCLAHFDTLKVGIEIILDEKLEEARKQKKIQEASKKLQLLNQNLKSQ